MQYLTGKPTIPELMRQRAREQPEHVYCTFEGQSLTMSELDRRTDALAAALLATGLERGDRICLMLPNSLEHVLLFFACIKAGLVQVPVNVKHTGASLQFLLEHSQPKALIADTALAAQVLPVLDDVHLSQVFWHRGVPDGAPAAHRDLEALLVQRDTAALHGGPQPDDLLFLTYTSGTTGMPKGVMVTEKMVRATALGCILIADLKRHDVFYLWEPFYHVTGSETLVIGIMEPITLAIAARFSASRFWDECRACGATHMHFVGGVLQLLLRQPPSPQDRDHRVRIAWGGGCPVQTWNVFQDRFGVEIREGYGMTETSSFATINLDNKIGTVGTAIPWFDVRVVDIDTGEPVAANVEGQVVVKALEPGLLTAGYFNNPEATRGLVLDGWLQTGDRGYLDDEGHLIFKGRIKDSVRRRGENISAWEVERVINAHPEVEESALVGVVNEFNDEDLKIFVRRSTGATLNERDLIAWCKPKMPSFQVPRFVAFVDAFSKTPSERIQKKELSKSITDCWDGEKA
ncbi:class I adenylate-forming enzyme family protein [Paraburkholderia sp. ZP32-5]|uniref:class I adenylate-forming enzyme family protein n=1 Tax=Paraburkholderia sp. ZP32-5 TaxID=2883245 RepID=UPI001F2C7CA0|nr:AMP-binding protein [Paraburkholderia sp. ZP32-5]